MEVELLSHIVVLLLTFWEISILFFKVAVPIYILTTSTPGFLFLHILVISSLFDNNHSNRYEVIIPHFAPSLPLIFKVINPETSLSLSGHTTQEAVFLCFNHPRARYQVIRDHPYSLQPGKVFQTSQTWPVYTALPWLFLRKCQSTTSPPPHLATDPCQCFPMLLFMACHVFCF